MDYNISGAISYIIHEDYMAEVYADEHHCEQCGCMFYDNNPLVVRNSKKDRWKTCSKDCAGNLKEEMESLNRQYGENEAFKITYLKEE